VHGESFGTRMKHTMKLKLAVLTGVVGIALWIGAFMIVFTSEKDHAWDLIPIALGFSILSEVFFLSLDIRERR